MITFLARIWFLGILFAFTISWNNNLIFEIILFEEFYESEDQ